LDIGLIDKINEASMPQRNAKLFVPDTLLSVNSQPPHCRDLVSRANFLSPHLFEFLPFNPPALSNFVTQQLCIVHPISICTTL